MFRVYNILWMLLILNNKFPLSAPLIKEEKLNLVTCEDELLLEPLGCLGHLLKDRTLSMTSTEMAYLYKYDNKIHCLL